MSRSFKYDIALNEQIRNRLFSFFEKIFELSNSDQFLLNWYGGYIENSKLDLIAGKYYSKSKLPLLIDDIFTGKLGVEFIIGDFFLQSIDTDYIY
ncbi:MAG TPA: hypothetical protein ENO18_06215, partial [Caldithrix sp.]|nr:hypothetical protein [Caldithrix sp.]